jgi:hypothetical protein
MLCSPVAVVSLAQPVSDVAAMATNRAAAPTFKARLSIFNYFPSVENWIFIPAV